MQTIHRRNDLAAAIADLRENGPIALVPTMGALHQGHLALLREGQARGGQVVVSIFVNPRQFGAGEDLAAYPRRLAEDAMLLREHGASLLWAPDAAAIYPADYATTVCVTGVSEGLCGAARPGHFAGVATIVAKLFHQIAPDIALFGEKDWQQLVVIRRMARDLDFTRPRPEAIIGVPTVREADGLAMSSRNAYLAPSERAKAAALPQAMAAAVEAITSGKPVAAGLAELEARLLSHGFARIDYAALCDAETLAPLSTLGDRPARLLVAAWMGTTRLIDNIAVRPAPR